MFKPVLVVPLYNHGEPFRDLAGKLVSFDLPVIVVDDGSNRETQDVLREINEQYEILNVLHHRRNRGKGKAVMTGITHASARGFTHALQIDADFQHDPSDIPELLNRAKQHPESLVLGIPSYDDSIPSHRFYFRYLTHVWIWIETLSFAIPDALCGFRVYPVERTLGLVRRHEIGNYMEFDPALAVRFYWEGGDIKTLDTDVRYLPEVPSNYRPVGDTARISWMHFRSVLGMLYRFPQLLRRSIGDRQEDPSTACGPDPPNENSGDPFPFG